MEDGLLALRALNLFVRGQFGECWWLWIFSRYGLWDWGLKDKDCGF